MKEIALSRDGRRLTTIQSLSDLTSAIAFRRCSDKTHSRRVLERAGLHVPAARVATFDEEDVAFLDEWKEIVVKPARGEKEPASPLASSTTTIWPRLYTRRGSCVPRCCSNSVA